MAFRSDLSKLTIPTDIGDEEKFHRQKMIEDACLQRLLQCYAKEIYDGRRGENVDIF